MPQGGPGVPESVAIPVFHLQKHDLRLKYYGKTGRKELESAVIEDMLSEMKKDYSIVIVTHNIAQAKRIADEVAVIFDGRLIENGSAAEVFELPKQQLTREFLAGIYG
jgi:ABC-type transporter Mla maintaining outer membrane lipid asymmetry ATPase subunit MlaF